MDPATFRNAPFTDFSAEAEKVAFTAALARCRDRAGEETPLLIGGDRISTEERITSLDPGETDRVVASSAKADRSHLERAFEAAGEAFSSWSRTSAEERAGVAFRAAEIMRERRHDLSAQMVYEVGKTWPEADGDTAEAIDFMEYYAREALRWGADHPCTPYEPEENVLRYVPLGIGAVIPPWNFPLAILAGMTTAAWVTGNTVLLKPSSDSPGIGWRFMEVLEEAGLPQGVVNFLPGPGADVGDGMVTDSRTRFVSFTGSKEVGLGINERAARTVPGQIWIKRVVAEMGGKDAILVDETADIEAAAAGVVAAAYGFQGQKCSACSRLIAHRDVHDELVERVVEGARALRVGHPEDGAMQMGAVINERAFKDILEYCRVGREEGDLLTGGRPVAAGNGWYLEPTVVSGLAPDDRLMQEEIFGPVLGVTSVGSFEEGLAVANGTEYGLTGAFYTRDPERVERGVREFHVGNLYVNRKCTGALVGVHPFGGFNMSGTDSKAGGPDYLGLFLQAKSVSVLKGTLPG